MKRFESQIGIAFAFHKTGTLAQSGVFE
jgi:hypothetical protein